MVNRYSSDINSRTGVSINDNGNLVSFGDYSEAERYGRQADITIDNLEAKCAALAAEVQSVKAMNDCLSEELRGYESDGAFEGPKMHLLWWKSETPTTDAFLDEVRAQGVEMLIEHCKQKAFVKSYDFFMDAGAVAESFAAQLRKEAK